MYLDPQNGKEPMFKAAVRLLHNHGESLDPFRVLEVIIYCIPQAITYFYIYKHQLPRFHKVNKRCQLRNSPKEDY